MRQLFNNSRIVDRVASGELTEKVVDDRHPALSLACEPICTQSQIVSYRDSDGTEITRAHRYLRKDGTVGASGKPDPNLYLDGSILYYLVRVRKRI